MEAWMWKLLISANIIGKINKPPGITAQRLIFQWHVCINLNISVVLKERNNGMRTLHIGPISYSVVMFLVKKLVAKTETVVATKHLNTVLRPV